MIPGDIEIDLHRLANGEPIRWRGLSSGETDRLQGLATMAASAMMAVVSAPAAGAALAALRDPAGAAQNAPALAFSILGLFAVAGAALVFLRGWGLFRGAGRVAWAVTTRRLIRMVGGDADRARAWTKHEILKVERRGAGDAVRIAVSVRRAGMRNRTLIIADAADLEAAEHALSGLEPAGGDGKSS